MNQLHLPFLEWMLVTPLLGAVWVARQRDPQHARRYSIIISAATLLFAVGAWLDFSLLQATVAHDRWDLTIWLTGATWIVVDELSTPLLPLAALLYLLVTVTTVRTKVRRFSFAGNLISESILLATFSCQSAWGLIGLLAAGCLPPYLELRARRGRTRLYALHMLLFVGMLVAGWWLVTAAGPRPQHSLWATGLLVAAVLLRCGIVPVHCWITDLFERATFGTALLFVTPMAGAYAAVRLVLPIAPDAVLRGMVWLSLATAVYAAGMALVQTEARRFFCYLFLSHSSLVLVGLEFATPVGLTGALSVWLSAALALTGFGIVLRSIEARTGRLSLSSFHGLHDRAPMLGAFFLLTGLASVGFPGTIGFIGMELLVDGVAHVNLSIGMLLVIAATLNGVAVVQAYFRLFTGARHSATVSLQVRPPERVAILMLAALILAGGLYPQPGIASRYHAAMQLVRARHAASSAVDIGLMPERNPSHAGD
jgi:NADH-quinone oxidoreductase subunit M